MTEIIGKKKKKEKTTKGCIQAIRTNRSFGSAHERIYVEDREK
jgi:hypothetical protein